MSNAAKSFNLAKLVTPKGMKVEVFQSSCTADLQVYFEGSKADIFDLPITISDNTLADIIVRGIRSLEEERQVLNSRDRSRAVAEAVGRYEQHIDSLGT